MFKMLLLVFAGVCIVASVRSQAATPPRPVGFTYIQGKSTAKICLEIFIDLLCSDSKEAWPHIKDVANHYGPNNVTLIVHLFPHASYQNAFYVSLAAFVVRYLTHGTKTFDWMDKILLEKQNELIDQNFFNNSDADLLRLLGTWASEIGVDKTAFLNLTDRRNNNEFETYASVMWKFACSRGVAGTPTYFINGFNQPNILQSWTLAEWKLLLDPLLQPDIFDPTYAV